MEYIPSIDLSEMGISRASRIFSHASPDSRDRLIRLGFILLLDTFLNNHNRIPFMWDN